MVVVLEMKSQTLLCSRGCILWRLWFPGEIWVVNPIRVIGITIRCISWRLMLSNKIGLPSKRLSYRRKGGTLLSHMLN